MVTLVFRDMQVVITTLFFIFCCNKIKFFMQVLCDPRHFSDIFIFCGQYYFFIYCVDTSFHLYLKVRCVLCEVLFFSTILSEINFWIMKWHIILLVHFSLSISHNIFITAFLSFVYVMPIKPAYSQLDSVLWLYTYTGMRKRESISTVVNMSMSCNSLHSFTVRLEFATGTFYLCTWLYPMITENLVYYLKFIISHLH